ncbi:hypothetical protein GEV33_002705 [Tenebrio molitor]|uniref:Uncharacterized protein n=1 Tax=Tenebrio molitor TaxID=7067 RepID=A0A8J6LP64_TENMO|nr:hypothetical protein GEV33_002705 [Tenebrio molitor]
MESDDDHSFAGDSRKLWCPGAVSTVKVGVTVKIMFYDIGGGKRVRTPGAFIRKRKHFGRPPLWDEEGLRGYERPDRRSSGYGQYKDLGRFLGPKVMTFLGTPTSNAMRMATCVLHFNHGIMVAAGFSPRGARSPLSPTPLLIALTHFIRAVYPPFTDSCLSLPRLNGHDTGGILNKTSDLDGPQQRNKGGVSRKKLLGQRCRESKQIGIVSMELKRLFVSAKRSLPDRSRVET